MKRIEQADNLYRLTGAMDCLMMMPMLHRTTQKGDRNSWPQHRTNRRPKSPTILWVSKTQDSCSAKCSAHSERLTNIVPPV